jgi:hypothetical protein
MVSLFFIYLLLFLYYVGRKITELLWNPAVAGIIGATSLLLLCKFFYFNFIIFYVFEFNL